MARGGPEQEIGRAGIPEERLALSISEAAERMGIGVTLCRQLSRRADFPAIRLGTRVIIPVRELRVWLAAHVGEQL